MARVLRLHNPDNGVVVCHPVPPSARASHVALDVLHALGKHPQVSGWPGRRAATEHYAGLWLAAEEISDLLLVRADLFPPTALAELIALASDAGVRTWLIFDSPRHQRVANDTLSADPVARVEITKHTKAQGERTQPRADPWPGASPWLARSAAALTFTPATFEELDTHIQIALTTTNAWLIQQKRLTPRTLARFLDALTATPSGRHRYARLVGANSALLQHGLAAEILETARPANATISAPTTQQSTEIRAHHNPARAALHTLALLTDLDEVTLSGLALDQVGDSPDGIALGGYLLRGAAAAALRAHYTAITERRCPPTGRLFTPSQLKAYKGPTGTGPPAKPNTLRIRLAQLDVRRELAPPQQQLHTDFKPPTQATSEEASLILQLLELSPSRSRSLTSLTAAQTRAAHRLGAINAVGLHHGYIAATEELRFSQNRAHTLRYRDNVRPANLT
jgi:hypothetical protein